MRPCRNLPRDPNVHTRLEPHAAEVQLQARISGRSVSSRLKKKVLYSTEYWRKDDSENI